MPDQEPKPVKTWLLRRGDQAAAALLISVGLVFVAAWCVYRGGLSGRLVEVDRAQPQTIRFEVDVNEADWAELAQLPRIGPTLAKRIVESREADGLFTDVEDLRRVRGIGPKTLDGMRPYLRSIPPRGAVAGK